MREYRKNAGDIAAVPLHDNPRAGAAVDANEQMTTEDNVQTRHRPGAGGQDLAGLERVLVAVCREPFKLFARHPTKGPMGGKAFKKRR